VHTLISQFALPPCVLFAKDDDIAELQRTGAVLARKYLEEAAPEIPATLEQSILGEIGGVPVRGYIDLVDGDGPGARPGRARFSLLDGRFPRRAEIERLHQRAGWPAILWRPEHPARLCQR
jgi:hypothetical protein